MPPTLRAWTLRVFLVAFLLGAYFYAWRPYGRTAATRSVAVPLLRLAVGASPSPWAVRARRGGHRLVLQSSADSHSFGWTAPAGVRFLLPALGVAVLAPRRLYWLVLWVGHLTLGAVGLLFLCLGVTGGEVWFVLYDGLTQYLVDAFSLGVAVWAVVVEYDLGGPFADEED